MQVHYIIFLLMLKIFHKYICYSGSLSLFLSLFFSLSVVAGLFKNEFYQGFLGLIPRTAKTKHKS
jgi:hypothetical protein